MIPPALTVSSDLSANATRDIAAAVSDLLADVSALYLKTKNFHWHMSGSHFRDYHLMLDEQSDQIFAITDVLAGLCEDNGVLVRRMREAHDMIGEQRDVATASLLEVFIDETERRAWFLYEASHVTPGAGYCGVMHSPTRPGNISEALYR